MQAAQNVRKEVLLRCWRCSKIWVYRGLGDYYACCGNCHTSVSIEKHKLQVDQLPINQPIALQPTKGEDPDG